MSGTTTSVYRKILTLSIMTGLGAPMAVFAGPVVGSVNGGSGSAAGSANTSSQAPVASNRQLQAEVNQLRQIIQAQHEQIMQAQAAARHAEQVAAAAQQQAQRPALQPAPQPVASAPGSVKPVFSSRKGIKISLHGFVSATAFAANRSFSVSNGQASTLPLPNSAHGTYSGADVRNTRFWLDFSGAQFGNGWSGDARIAMDFFGSYANAGATGQQSPQPRLRQAYLDLNHRNTGTKIRIGQQWDLSAGLNTPISLAYIAFPLGRTIGRIHWRYPGVVLMQDLNHGSHGVKWSLDVGVFEGNWNGFGSSATRNQRWQSAGNVGLHPQYQVRLNMKYHDVRAYLTGTYAHIDMRGVGGGTTTAPKSTFASKGLMAGGVWTPGPWYFNVNAYTGKALGQLTGALGQYGDLQTTGGQIQVGYHFNPHWAVYLFQARGKVDKGDIVLWSPTKGGGGNYAARQSAASLIYTMGNVAFGLGWMNAQLKSLNAAGVKQPKISGHQWDLSAMYKF